MKSPVVILHNDRTEDMLPILRRSHADLEIHECNSYGELPSAIEATSADVAYSVRFAGTPDYPREAVLTQTSLKWISVGGSGTDHLTPWDPGRLTVTNSSGVAADMMAEYALGVMLHFSQGIPGFLAAKSRREWIAGSMEPVEGRTVLILGLGGTGQSVARKSKALGLRTLGVRARPQPTPDVDEVFGPDALPRLWERADFIVSCVPLLPDTKGLVDRTAFAAMKPSTVLVDVSRGGVVEELPLLNALQSGRIRGAALDVFNTEPLPPESPFWELENVIITPHCSSVYDGWELKSVEMFARNLARYRAGKPLRNVVDPERGY